MPNREREQRPPAVRWHVYLYRKLIPIVQRDAPNPVPEAIRFRSTEAVAHLVTLGKNGHPANESSRPAAAIGCESVMCF